MDNKIISSNDINILREKKLISDKITNVNNITRKEKILVLPYNTLRVFDTLVQVDIEKAKDPNWDRSFEDVLYDVLTRREKDLGKFNNVDSELVNKIIDEGWSYYYEIAPRTIVYSLIEYLYQQSFIEDIIALFHKKDAWDDALTCDYYDGTIEGLEKYIADNNITAIIMDDIELLKKLVDRGNVDMNWKTIFISRLGYNYHIVNDRTIMKYITELPNKACLEIGELVLINFDEEFIKERLNRKYGRT